MGNDGGTIISSFYMNGKSAVSEYCTSVLVGAKMHDTGFRLKAKRK